ncbi:hypothetical protein [Microvirga massiliensis]|uniref:hypothetical protein n=1 Tax=Microvirga massiliensis TaxID=1033741 RepID=UPI0006600E8F|nr:hypothetical protein [Microvirga massiliensis]
MNVWAFDLSIKTGVAMGRPPKDDLSRLNSMTVSLRKRKYEDVDEDIAHMCENLETFLDHRLGWKEDWPDRIVFEAPLNPTAKPRDGRPRGALELWLPIALVTTLRLKAQKERIPIEKVWPATVRAKFIDKANAGERRDTKKAVLNRCKEWGYLPFYCTDDNRADAVAIWHWAQRTHGRWTPPYEIMFGQRVPIGVARLAGAG